MSDLFPTGGGASMPKPEPPNGSKKSYTSVFMTSSPRTLKKSFIVGDELPAIKPMMIYKDKPGLFYSEEEMEDMGNVHPHALIGKFSVGWPTKEKIIQDFWAVGFSGPYSVMFLRPGFLFIDFKLEEDMARFWGKGRWFCWTMWYWAFPFVNGN